MKKVLRISATLFCQTPLHGSQSNAKKTMPCVKLKYLTKKKKKTLNEQVGQHLLV